MITVNFDPFPMLETERMILRDVRHSDMNDLFEIRSNPETMRYIPRPIAKVPEDSLALIEMVQGFLKANERINWAMVEKESGKLIGMMGYVKINVDNHRAEVGYSTNAAFTQKGYTFEALKAVIDYGFNEMKLNSIEAVIHPENIGSQKVVEKYGFTKDAYFKDYNYHNEQFADALVYSIITPHK